MDEVFLPPNQPSKTPATITAAMKPPAAKIFEVDRIVPIVPAGGYGRHCLRFVAAINVFGCSSQQNAGRKLALPQGETGPPRAGSRPGFLGGDESVARVRQPVDDLVEVVLEPARKIDALDLQRQAGLGEEFRYSSSV